MEQKKEGAYFWLNPEEKRMNVICETCHQDKPEAKKGAYWPGDKGYGPFDFICHFCNKTIHKGSNAQNQTTL